MPVLHQRHGRWALQSHRRETQRPTHALEVPVAPARVAERAAHRVASAGVLGDVSIVRALPAHAVDVVPCDAGVELAQQVRVGYAEQIPHFVDLGGQRQVESATLDSADARAQAVKQIRLGIHVAEALFPCMAVCCPEQAREFCVDHAAGTVP